MKELRDKQVVTRTLLLLELATGPYTTLAPLAKRLETTVQTVSEYLRAMVVEGLVAKRQGVYRPTQAGVAYLQEKFSLIRSFVTDQMGRLAIVDTTVAVAGAPIAAGQQVGLFMDRGRLVAHPGRSSPSSGIAIAAAPRGSEVGVRQLQGIVELMPAMLAVVALPTVHRGGSSSISIDRLREHLADVLVEPALRTYCLGPVAEAVAARLGCPVLTDGAVTVAAIEVAARGVPVLVLLEESQLAPLLHALEDRNRASEHHIPYQVVIAPRAHRDKLVASRRPRPSGRRSSTRPRARSGARASRRR